MKPGKDGSQWQEVKNESGGFRDVAANTDGSDRLTV